MQRLPGCFSGTGRIGSGVTLAVEGIDVSHAVEVKNSQMREFYLEAKAELGYTSSQLRQSPELKAKVDALKYKKLGKWMDVKGASVYNGKYLCHFGSCCK